MKTRAEVEDLLDRFRLILLIAGKVHGYVTYEALSTTLGALSGSVELTPEIVELVKVMIQEQGLEWRDTAASGDPQAEVGDPGAKARRLRSNE